ncbi:hypothetical protein FHS59_002749 [Algoriphagus iocasae]|uniref:Uncharacterized protein n=1 Tax=Algoriphagus iocasae TaxID=1836499 RepID=A0A841MYQ5_9BACT|nr:hypothetical protein [Algoriphagus iocasae]MBB6327121.1 hypothetical protein [Algoriphagus iocasae]
MNIRLIEEKLGEINPDILSIMLAQNPRSVMEIIKVFIPRSERETTLAWIERNAKSKDLADAFYFCREHALNSI